MTLVIIICIASVAALIVFLPIKGAASYYYIPPSKRLNEADTVLSRRLLTPGTDAYKLYYELNPDLREIDDRSRVTPGLLSEEARYYQPATFSASRANFELIDFLGHLTHGNPVSYASLPEFHIQSNLSNIDKGSIDPERVAGFISDWLKKTGAHSVGFTVLKDYHLYSHKGRGPRTGDPILHNHENAIAITVEMDHRMMQSAPAGSAVMESSEQYLRSGIHALKVAGFIRQLGYEATAHIDGKYDLICPLVAADAGLGVIGRMGLLMTPGAGPRVRISVVTTNMPIALSEPKQERTVLDFCNHCRKCAQVCPADAIPEGPRKSIDGIERWQINSERCYHFWTLSGTDCGRCITVCPYSHPDNGLHRFVRWGIKNNLVFRRLAIKLDDIFYGRKPQILPLPGWTDIMYKP